MMLPRFVPYSPMDETPYNMPKDEDFNAACNSEYSFTILLGNYQLELKIDFCIRQKYYEII